MYRTSPSALTRALARRAQAGMSLVEIMVVIAIIGILTTVIAVNVSQRLQDANVETTKLQMKRVEESLQLYSLKHGQQYPSTSEGLAAAKKYFPNEEVPKDSWGNDFQYFSPGTHGGDHPYEVISLGADKKEGGEDYNADIGSWDLK